VGGGKTTHGFWWKKLKRRYHLEDQSVDGIIILKLISNRQYLRAWIC
jgi:hypothetical protein